MFKKISNLEALICDCEGIRDTLDIIQDASANGANSFDNYTMAFLLLSNVMHKFCKEFKEACREIEKEYQKGGNVK